MTKIIMQNKHNFEIPSFEEFIKISCLMGSTLDDFSTEISVEDKYLILFRGQEEDWDLLPKISRYEYSNDILEKEKQIFEEFKRLSYPYLDPNLNSNEWDLLALAQHHRLPTRLLDWTENPLAALWFAFNKEKQNNSDRVVWCFFVKKDEIIETKNGSPFYQKVTRVFKPNHITKRITAQNGWFTVHKFTDRERFIALNNNASYHNRLMKLILPDDQRTDILNRLDKININYFSLFPDLEGLGNYLEWKNFKK